MGTRSTIAIQNADGTVTGIYCHWDGYLSHNGNILYQFYRDEDKVRALIELGNISSLGREIGTRHSFNDRPEGETTAFARDRGEKDQEARTYATWREFIDSEGQEYDYLFQAGQGWVVNHYEGMGPLKAEMDREETA